MNIKQRIINICIAHPKMVMAFAGIAIAVVASTAVGLISPEQVLAPGGACTSCRNFN